MINWVFLFYPWGFENSSFIESQHKLSYLFLKIILFSIFRIYQVDCFCHLEDFALYFILFLILKPSICTLYKIFSVGLYLKYNIFTDKSIFWYQCTMSFFVQSNTIFLNIKSLIKKVEYSTIYWVFENSWVE